MLLQARDEACIAAGTAFADDPVAADPAAVVPALAPLGRRGGGRGRRAATSTSGKDDQ